jgi:uncharacterized protein
VSVIISAVGIGIGVLFAGNLPWAVVLAPLNLRFAPAVPWAIVPMAAYLWAYWRYIGGAIGDSATATTRRALLRANTIPFTVWPLAVLTGLTGFGALLALLTVMARLIAMPASAPIETPAGMPTATALVLLTMSSLVAGVTEEAAFRGYMQGPIERRHGLAAGILVNGTMFGLLHFPNHPGAVLSMLPYYLAVSAVYGGLTWAANSILPALALHVGGDIWSLTRLWSTGRPEWQLSDSTPAPVWTTGPDLAFVGSLTALVALAAITTAMCVLLRRVVAGAGDDRDEGAAERASPLA